MKKKQARKAARTKGKEERRSGLLAGLVVQEDEEKTRVPMLS